MGKCPHCGFTGTAEIEQISHEDNNVYSQQTGQLVCPSCDAILGGTQSFSYKGPTP